MTQPEALRLAERIEGWVHQDEMNIEDAMKAADELRRLYRVSDDLRESLNHKSYYQARLTKHMREMKVQRDELLEALKMLVLATNKVSIGDYNEEVHDIALSKARAAIAKAQQ